MVLQTIAYFGVIVLDRLLKWLVESRMYPGQSIAVAPFLHITLVHNTGAAFGFLRGLQPLLAVLGLLVGVGVFWIARRVPPREAGLRVALGAVGGGAIGNFIDRVAYGHVLDFVDLRIWPVFNLADSAIFLGGLYLAWRLLLRQGSPGVVIEP
ncbi:MAG: signal peptidase II [Bacillota bacterium]|nr:signal peptidase II [Bacillota bacterium]